ncbi:hypothetical protein BH10CHL1_BH10CHL1_42070 [soil metagenome]
MIVTRVAFSKQLNKIKYDQLAELATRLGRLRTKVWDKYGSISGIGLGHRDVRDSWLDEERVFDVQARLWKQTLSDTMNDVITYREAAKVKVRKAIFHRTKDKEERKRLYILLKHDRWLDDLYLSRMMRKYFKHGHTSVDNQIVVDVQCYTAFKLKDKGKTWISVTGLIARQRIAIPLNTTVIPTGTLRLILRDGRIEVHYAIDAKQGKACGEDTTGIDKGYTEAFTDSEGQRHGEGLGDKLSNNSDYLKLKYQRRNKLKAISDKKPQVKANNLGRKKLDQRKQKHQSSVRDICYKAAHSVVDKAKVIVCEDLTSPIPDKKKYGKNQSRRLSGWVKGTMAEALEMVSQRRGSSLSMVNAAYTSQMDSRYGVLLGTRNGDTFYGFDQVVQDADTNAARNILARHGDKDIFLYTPYKQVKAILLRRTAEVQTRLGLLNPGSSCNDTNGTALSTERELPFV